MFRKSELREFAKQLTREEAESIMLPIIIRVDTSIEPLTGFIDEEPSAKIVARILNVSYDKPPLALYMPQIAFLRSKFSTIFQIAIHISFE